MRGPRYWILDRSGDGLPVEREVGMWEWAQFFEGDFDLRRVARTQIKDGPEVSTVFLGLDHNFAGLGANPFLYETMVFKADEWKPGMTPGEAMEFEAEMGMKPPRYLEEGHWVHPDCDQERCATYEQAIRMHERMVERWGAAIWNAKHASTGG